jgi:hypothetical protein
MCPSSGILKKASEHSVSETGSVSLPVTFVTVVFILFYGNIGQWKNPQLRKLIVLLDGIENTTCTCSS